MGDFGAERRGGGSRLSGMVLLLMLAGCGMPLDQTAESTDNSRPVIAVDELLENVVKTYRQTRRYDDRGTIELSYRDGERLVSDTADISVSYVRPNRLSARLYHASIHSDGRRWRAWVRDEASGNLDGQMIDRPVPQQLGLRELYADPLLLEQLSNAVLREEAGRTPLQLELLLAEEGVELLRDDNISKRISGEEDVDGHACYRVELNTRLGLFVLWIDRTYYVVRKLLYPRTALVPELADNRDLKDVQLIAHFRGALLDFPGQRPQFRLDVPEQPRKVRYFVRPPQPLPSDLFGKPAGEFSFAGLGGDGLSSARLGGRPTVLLFFHEHPTCETALQQLAAVRTQRKGAADSQVDSKAESATAVPEVAFYGVCTEPSSVADSHLQALMARWKVDLPIVRDRAALGRDLFHFQGAPALLVLDAQGVVQIVEVGLNPRLSEELPVILDRLARGEDIAAEVLRRQADETARYERELAQAGGDEDPQRISPTAGQLYPATAPRLLQREQRWSVTDLQSPGNLLAVPAKAAGGTARIFVVDAPRRLVELNPAGSVVARRDLELPSDVRVAQVRFALDPLRQDRFAVADFPARRVFLCDSDGRVTATLPADEPAEEIVDFGWAPGEAEGVGELWVVFAGERGSEIYDTQGKLRRRLAVAEPPATWLALPQLVDGAWRAWIGQRGGRPSPSAEGAPLEAPRDVAGKTLKQVFAAAYPPPAPSMFAALADNPQGRQLFVAFNGQFVEQWNYPLPTRSERTAVEPVRSTLLFRDRRPFWLLAAADGTVHLISADGSFSDFFSLGVPIQGIAALRHDGNTLVMLSTAEGVTAWTFETP